jgi:hypothetical protein
MLSQKLKHTNRIIMNSFEFLGFEDKKEKFIRNFVSFLSMLETFAHGNSE